MNERNALVARNTVLSSIRLQVAKDCVFQDQIVVLLVFPVVEQANYVVMIQTEYKS